MWSWRNSRRTWYLQNAFVQNSSLAIGLDGMAVALLATNFLLVFHLTLLYGVLSVGKVV